MSNADGQGTSSSGASPRVPWTKRDVFAAAILDVALAVVLIVGTLALAAYFRARGTPWSPRTLGMVMSLAELGHLVPAWLLGVRKYRLPWSCVGFRPFDRLRGLGLGCVFLLCTFAFNFLWAVVLSVLRLPGQPELLPLFGPGFVGLALGLFVAGVVAPVVEEAFFRGYVFAGLRTHFGMAWGLLGSAAFFAVFHVLPTSWPPIFVMGIAFALLYENTGSIWPPIVVHGAINSFSLVVSYLLPYVQR